MELEPRIGTPTPFVLEGGPLMQRHNFAARAARWSASHWKTAVAIWMAFVVVAIALGTAAGTHKLSASEQSTGESARAEQILANAGFKTPASEAVLVRSRTRTVADPEFRATVQLPAARIPASRGHTLRSVASRATAIVPAEGDRRRRVASSANSSRTPPSPQPSLQRRRRAGRGVAGGALTPVNSSPSYWPRPSLG